jgi:glycosyltransferase involved in cell wall biosynthesis
MKKSLSVIIIAKDEERSISDCLTSVAWADEIIVVDSQSQDRTVDIALRFTDRIFIRKWKGYADGKQFALEQAAHDWVLSIDADERVSPELKNEIQAVLQQNTDHSGFKIPRQNYFLGKWITSCFWYPDFQLKLFKKDGAKVIQVKVHEGFSVNGTIGTLHGNLVHLSYQSLHDALEKINRYSSLSAEERVNQKKVKAHHIIFHPMAAFLTDFISRKGYKDGMYGLLVSFLNMMTNMLMYMKIWEAQNIRH